MTVGHRPLESFPDLGFPHSWRRGYRSALLYFYHFVWWPWYCKDSWLPAASRLISRVATQFRMKGHKRAEGRGKVDEQERDEG
ncbi:hypothetical protein CR51_16350 [Caballeronia megalochromosomata]|nr:hypothetical protein CR51_16350 [Caballeronia megalochromosomata]